MQSDGKGIKPDNGKKHCLFMKAHEDSDKNGRTQKVPGIAHLRH